MRKPGSSPELGWDIWGGLRLSLLKQHRKLPPTHPPTLTMPLRKPGQMHTQSEPSGSRRKQDLQGHLPDRLHGEFQCYHLVYPRGYLDLFPGPCVDSYLRIKTKGDFRHINLPHQSAAPQLCPRAQQALGFHLVTAGVLSSLMTYWPVFRSEKAVVMGTGVGIKKVQNRHYRPRLFKSSQCIRCCPKFG